MIERFNIDKFIDILAKLLFIISLAFALTISINSVLAYKFFYLNKNVKLKQIQQKIENNNKYSYLPYIFKKIKSQINENMYPTTVSSSNIETNQPLNLNIKLIGTVFSSREKVAFIQDKEGLKIIKQGDKIGRFRVKKINKYSVILTDGRKLYKISIFIGKSKTTTSRRNPYLKPKVVRNNYRTLEGSHYEISKREVEKQTEDLGKLLRYVRIVPVVRGGETKGYKFAYVSPRSILYKYGLRSGDIIISVNGLPVRTAEEAFKIYNMLRNETNIRLEVERKGKREIITYEIK